MRNIVQRAALVVTALTLSVTMFTGCSFHINLRDTDGNSVRIGNDEDKYSATLDSKADAWNVKYNPKDNCVGSSIDDTCALNGTKYVDFISEINNGKSIDDYDESDWLVVELTGKSDASELSTATSWYTATLINNIGIAFGDTNKTSIDEISKYVKKGQEIKFICTKGKISGYDCLLPIMYDKGDGTYLYEPGLSALDIEIK